MRERTLGRAAGLAAIILVLAAHPAPAVPTAAGQAVEYKPYVMDHDYFSCEVPAAWDLERDAEEDEEYRIFEFYVHAPAPRTSINVRYLLKDNEDFAGYQNFLDRNSKNVLGETKNSRESYGPVEKVALAGLPAFRLRRDRMVFLHPESKSDESASLKELLYVVPISDGSFYVLEYSADASAYETYLPVFEHVAASLKPGIK
ncbi:MAG TPA: hypothetical protein P5119_04280 [Candidatus Aminicenantes bacterium]|nr:hypothetical protein [Candidatus Aminicenantes bacterium]HRY64542.1 hypothetical protein [Candidatus Aminicenantes bacterium]HRZ71455.1 hypothetical protein [Candidatus Aminicenantes bacterium]